VNAAQQQFLAALQQLTDSLSQAASERLLALITPEPSAPSQAVANAKVRVWANKRNGLYYCPGDRRFKRGTSGKWMTQQEAERYNFLPAPGAPCQ
jgi:hypothetical protein